MRIRNREVGGIEPVGEKPPNYLRKSRMSMNLFPVLRIRMYYYADPDSDPVSKKCPYGSGS